MPAVRHLREVDDVEPRFGAPARRLEVERGQAGGDVGVVRGERAGTGERGDGVLVAPGVGQGQRRGSRTSPDGRE